MAQNSWQRDAPVQGQKQLQQQQQQQQLELQQLQQAEQLVARKTASSAWPGLANQANEQLPVLQF